MALTPWPSPMSGLFDAYSLGDAYDEMFEPGLLPRPHYKPLYHRLLGNEHPDSVDRDWNDEMSMLLAGAADDFAPDSEARAYLLGRTANTLLPPKSMQQLSPQLALDHIARTGAQLGSFDDTRIEPVVMTISQRIANPQVASSYPHPAKAVLLAKTGQWNVPASFDGGAGDDPRLPLCPQPAS